MIIRTPVYGDMMNLITSVIVALNQLRTNKLRSILSLVGILIAVGSVTGIVSIGDGLQKYLLSEFEQMGGYSQIWSWAPDMYYRNASGNWVKRPWEEFITMEDIRAIKQESDKVEFVVSNMNFNGPDWPVRYHANSLEGYRVTCSTSDYNMLENWSVGIGRFINDLDLIHNTKVVVLGKQVATDLFGADVNPIEKEIKISQTRYTVVGVMEDKKFFDNDFNDRIIIPVTTAQKRITGNDRLHWITVKAKTPADVPEVVEAMKRVYKRLHKHGEDYNIRTGMQALEEINKVLLILKVVAGGIAGISLIVGGIGIMNIMLVSVTERTREIGIRKALGANRATVLWQFLVEAVVLCMVGGLLGIILGFVLGAGIAAYITSLTHMTFISVISIKMMAFAAGFSLFVGVTFGVYPAWRASRLDPVDALRYE